MTVFLTPPLREKASQGTGALGPSGDFQHSAMEAKVLVTGRRDMRT
eukprot:CAMPEP_0184668010 /NCGR_PEP_ID=MMETSP0308-20130426/70281_2 /TAXON_ID=38269 /ORGANISM="Gloeochaete witrockiana, Strain SAG 46.84" /LENGTH=45 /DNA_ID= /DNA_START= /DNA_END= /DNA_ORIENTATION=